MATATDIWAAVEPYLTAERLELDDVELSGIGRGQTVRVVVDGDKLDIDRLAELSRGLSRLLDNDLDLADSYQLEVSSPGLERKLRRPAHYRKSIGREVVVKTERDGKKKTVRGIVADSSDDGFIIEGDEGQVALSYEDVLTAKTVFRWERTPKPGH